VYKYIKTRQLCTKYIRDKIRGMPKKPRRTQKKRVPAARKISAVRRKNKKPVVVQIYPEPSTFSTLTTKYFLLQKRVVKLWQKQRSNWTKQLGSITQKNGRLFSRQWKHAKKQLGPTLQQLKKSTIAFLIASGRQTKKIVKVVARELLYPFYYIFRYHFWATMASLIMTAMIFGGAYATYEIAFKDLPPVSKIVERKQPLTTKILDRNGKLLYRIYKDENRTLIHLSDVPEVMKQATISIEDRDFYHHHGISVKGILRALKENSQGNRIQGGSTLTQQLVKNTLLTSERTVKRKIREIILSFLVEQTYTKEQILEMYLNEIAYGGSTYGIEEAAQRYFGKSARQLDLAESSFLAGLPQSPSVYSPFGSTPELAYARQKEVLRRMVEDKFITQEQADQARQQTLVFKADITDIEAPHFVMYVRDLLAQQFGEELVNQGGLEVRTTLDLDLHNETQAVVTKELESLARLRISNGAALVTNPKTGEILSMVGSKNYFDFKNDGQVNVTVRPRQPGSSIKPLTYAVAFERGQMPSTTIADEPVTFSIAGSPPYSPKNYDGRFHGNVTLREALGSSYNIPAVKTLANIGISTLIDKGEEMGVTTWRDRKRFGLSLTLGGGEVLMTELAQIYGTFATYGNTVTLQPLLEVKSAQGEVLFENRCAKDGQDCPSTRTLSTKTAYQITDVLSDNNARTPAFGARSVLVIPNQQVAVKTGTTNNLRDNWTVGYTQDRVVAVWVGNNDNTPMSYVASGVTGASPIWNKIIRLTLSDDKPHQFSTPEGMVRVKICVQTRTLPCRGCPTVREELFEAGKEPTAACSPSQFPPSPRPQASPNPRDQILQGVTIDQPPR
jgi:1A family penicillin-binding protein